MCHNVTIFFLKCVDMEFLIKQSGHNSVEVDIGFVPQLELEASHPSMKAVDGDADLRDIPLAVSILFALKDFLNQGI